MSTSVLPDVEQQLWLDYWADRTVVNRNRLVVFYLPLTKRAARAVYGKVPYRTEVTELAGYAAFGLIWAIDRYDPAHGESFERYVFGRLVGAIWDELRRVSWQSRSTVIQNRRLERAKATLLGAGRPVTDASMAVIMNISVPAVKKLSLLCEASGLPMSWDVPINDADGGDLTLGMQQPSFALDPSQQVDRQAGFDALAVAVRQLTGRESQVIQMYDVQGMTLALIGAEWGVTESRACQIHAKAVKHLRELLEDKM